LMSNPHTTPPSPPISIDSQDSETVSFKIVNPFQADIFAMFYQYPVAVSGNTVCSAEAPFASCPKPVNVTAHCMTGAEHPLAIVDIWFVDSSVIDTSDNDTVPECCHPDDDVKGKPKVVYTYKIYCESRCRRRSRNLASEEWNEAIKASNVAPLLGREEEQKATHHCSAMDYPCGADGNLFVNVCHYSTKEGYQTYCVPESDSDVISYMPKDYCGPCVGGFGGGAKEAVAA